MDDGRGDAEIPSNRGNDVTEVRIPLGLIAIGFALYFVYGFFHADLSGTAHVLLAAAVGLGIELCLGQLGCLIVSLLLAIAGVVCNCINSLNFRT